MSVTLKGAERFFAQTMANSSDEEQAAFFNEFGRLLPLVCRTGLGAENQLCMLTRCLDSSGRQLLLDLAEFVKIDNDQVLKQY